MTSPDVRFVRFRQLPQLTQRRFADEVLALNPEREEVEHLQGTAVDVWQMLEVPRTLPSVVTKVADMYELPPSDIERDIATLLDDLVARSLVEEVIEFDC